MLIKIINKNKQYREGVLVAGRFEAREITEAGAKKVEGVEGIEWRGPFSSGEFEVASDEILARINTKWAAWTEAHYAEGEGVWCERDWRDGDASPWRESQTLALASPAAP